MRHFALKEMQKNMRMRVSKLEKSLVKTKARKLCQIRTHIYYLDMHECKDRENVAAKFVGKSSNLDLCLYGQAL